MEVPVRLYLRVKAAFQLAGSILILPQMLFCPCFRDDVPYLPVNEERQLGYGEIEPRRNAQLGEKSSGERGIPAPQKGRTSSILVLSRGTPIAYGGMFSGNHNDLYNIVPQYAAMVRQNLVGICLDNSSQNADRGFDSKQLRSAIQRRKMVLNIKENTKKSKGERGREHCFNEGAYRTRLVNGRCFAWVDSFGALLIRFDTLDSS